MNFSIIEYVYSERPYITPEIISSVLLMEYFIMQARRLQSDSTEKNEEKHEHDRLLNVSHVNNCNV